MSDALIEAFSEVLNRMAWIFSETAVFSCGRRKRAGFGSVFEFKAVIFPMWYGISLFPKFLV